MSTNRSTAFLRLWIGLLDEAPGFRRDLRRQMWKGLQIVGALATIGAVVFVLGRIFFVGGQLRWVLVAPLGHRDILMTDKVVTVAVGLFAIAAGRRRVPLSRGRGIGALIAVVGGAATLYSDLLHGNLNLGYLTAIFAVVVVLIPFRPWQTLSIGIVILAMQEAVGQGLRSLLALPPVATGLDKPPVQPAMLALLMTGVSATLYRSRYRQYKARREAEILRDDVAELEAAKSRFYANVSHDLRTPLTLILGPLEDALGGHYGALPAALKDRLASMKRQAERLQTLVQQLLHLSRLDEGRMDLEARPVDLKSHLERTAGLFGSMADRRSIEVRIDVPDRLEACADPEALERIVSNLLSNALEHTPDGGTVHLRATAPATDEEQVVLSVRDSGPGLPPEMQESLFDRYAGTDASRAQASTGPSTGIGLALVKELTERHGGSVAATSEDGFGTEITVRLPRHCSALPPEDRAGASEAPPRTRLSAAPVPVRAGSRASNAAARGDEQPPPPDERPSVLVVDDEAEVRDYLREVLGDRYAVRTAADGEEGLRAARRSPPALVISDVVMPRRDGYELCRALRNDADLRTVPIILLTVQDEDEHVLEGLQRGADAYLGKPFRPEELRQRAENLIEIRRYVRAAANGPASSDDAPASNGSRPGESSVDESEVLRAARDAVEEHLANSNFGVDWLADEVGLSPRQLQRRLQDEVGLSAAAFIRAVRLRRAADLLRDGTVDTVKATASAVGYRDPSYFSRLFEEAHGRPPSAMKP